MNHAPSLKMPHETETQHATEKGQDGSKRAKGGEQLFPERQTSFFHCIQPLSNFPTFMRNFTRVHNTLPLCTFNVLLLEDRIVRTTHSTPGSTNIDSFLTDDKQQGSRTLVKNIGQEHCSRTLLKNC